MGQHTITYLESSTQPTTVTARCRCGQRSEKCKSRQEAEDWTLKHQADVEILKAHLGTSSPTLRAQRDYYRKMADEGAPEDRALWRQLADELDRRLNDSAPQDDDPLPLFG